MSYLVFDIETVGKPYDEFDEASRGIFEEWAERWARDEQEKEQELENIKKGLPFSPFWGEIVAIGMLDGKDQGAVYFQAPGQDIKDFEENGVQYRSGTEQEILARFWEVAENYATFVTFNGRGFDAPYLMIRSAVQGVKPSRNLMPPRYLSQQKYGPQHIDLSDQLTFYSAVRRMPKLHFVAQAFGLESPKEGGMDGAEVPAAFREGRYQEIARYCMGDVFATKKLFEIWDQYLNFGS